MAWIKGQEGRIKQSLLGYDDRKLSSAKAAERSKQLTVREESGDIDAKTLQAIYDSKIPTKRQAMERAKKKEEE